MAVYNNLPGSPIITVSDTSNESVSVGTTETTLLTITAPLSGKYLILASVTFSGRGSQNKDIFFRIRNQTNSDEELAQGFWYAGYQSQTAGAGNMTIYALADISANDEIISTLRVASNSVYTQGITSLTAIRIG